MTNATSGLAIELTVQDISNVEADLVAIPVFEQDGFEDLAGLAAATGDEVTRAIASKEFKPKPFELFLTPAMAGIWRAKRIALVGVGPSDKFSMKRLRLAAAAAATAARQRRIDRIAFLARGGFAVAASVQAIAEGIVLGSFDAGRYKTTDHAGVAPCHAQVIAHAANSAAARDALARGMVLAESCNLARSLANEPGNVLTPRVFAERAGELTTAVGIDTELFDETRIGELKMGMLLGVARGSAEPPRLIVMRYAPDGAPETPVLGLVGKGITFDTGGISIKPADGMERMKDDMAGGAAVVCAMRAIGILKPRIKVIGVVPTTENMPGGRAIKPGDILTSASGKTVEVINTDAEGRLILGDALWYARELGATHVVDVATLTGACVVALGKTTSGLFGRPDSWVEAVRRAAEAAGDPVWHLPLVEEYLEQLRSEIADLSNSGGRPAGAITAALFLQEFAGPGPWVHLDIAGTAWSDDATPYQGKGPTGVAVRTLAELALSSSQWGLTGQERAEISDVAEADATG
ncbi:MAG: leucyl aminopeptidase [Acidobacteria bacterium]|nr:leucyl aminopeptidase [Acidobacteriota bacterium]